MNDALKHGSELLKKHGPIGLAVIALFYQSIRLSDDLARINAAVESSNRRLEILCLYTRSMLRASDGEGMSAADLHCSGD